MKIISNFTDYYDSMRCYSMCSDDFTYIRKTEELILDKRYGFTALEYDDYFKYKIEFFVIGFCGKFYQGYKVIIDNGYESRYKLFYDLSKALKFSLNYKLLKKDYKKGIYDYGSIFRFVKGKTLEQFMENGFNKYIKKINNEFKRFSNEFEKMKLFEEYNAPVIMLNQGRYDREISLTLNPDLSKLCFFKVFEGHYAYQELEMYLGNILLQKEDPTQITDDLILAQQKGFDKMSFRRYPTK